MDRREFLKWISASAAGFGVNQTLPRAEIAAFIQLARITDPIWSASIFETELVYPDSRSAYKIVAFGDSQFEPPNSPPEFFASLMDQKTPGRWKVENFAKWGWSTTQIIKDQLSQDSLKQGNDRLSLWLTGGGNNLTEGLADTQAKIDRLVRVTQNRVHPDIFSLISDAEKTISAIGPQYQLMIDTLNNLYRDRIDNIVVVATPNFLACHEIGTSKGLNIDPKGDPITSFLIYRLSVKLHDTIVTATQQYQQATRGKNRILVIDTWDFGQADFEKDEHWNKAGKEKIASRAASRVKFVQDTRSQSAIRS